MRWEVRSVVCWDEWNIESLWRVFMPKQRVMFFVCFGSMPNGIWLWVITLLWYASLYYIRELEGVALLMADSTKDKGLLINYDNHFGGRGRALGNLLTKAYLTHLHKHKFSPFYCCKLKCEQIFLFCTLFF